MTPHDAHRPSDATFHALADDRLPESEREALELWLADHAEDAAWVEAVREQNEALRHAYAPCLEAPLPDRLLAAARKPPRRCGWGIRWAAAVGWLVLGVVIGHFIPGSPSSRAPAAPALVREAAVAHAVYVPEVRHPVEVGADQEAHLVQWLSKRLNRPLRVPHLDPLGYALVGGRLLPGDSGPVAQFMYEESGGQRLTLYVRTETPEGGDTAFRYAREGRYGVFYWVDGKLGYALSGEMPRETLLAVAESVYRQLSP